MDPDHASQPSEQTHAAHAEQPAKPTQPLQSPQLPSQSLPQPGEVRKRFGLLLAHDPEQAVSYLHGLGVASGYLDPARDARNIRWSAPSPYGTLECTINLAKPEKDPRAIAKAGAQRQPGSGTQPDTQPGTQRQPESGTLRQHDRPPIPCCDLCWENEGYPGSPEHPAKPGLRIAAITLGGETWGLQFSPYAYFQEHCIALSRDHRPMKIDAACLERLLDFVDLFPFYFVGSNADLPIVGGSILSHDHFQGGRHTFPLMRAPVERTFSIPEAPGVRCGVVRWPASTIRLESADRHALISAATRVLATWKTFSDESCSIRASSLDATGARIPHNTLNPIARRAPNGYVLDLILRNNRTDSAHPWGIFHPGEDLHHIKRENIGLIEIMGLAILPPRLARELPAVETGLREAACQHLSANAVMHRLENDPDTSSHARWAADVYASRLPEILRTCSEAGSPIPHTETGASTRMQDGLPSPIAPYLEDEVARVFGEVLDATGVFKRTPEGMAGWESFIGDVAGN